MIKRYFKIKPVTQADAEQLRWLFTNKKFYPEKTSVPPLPVSYTNGFDYRQLLKFISFDNFGNAIVYTRSQYTVVEFNTNVIPTADWTTRYYFSVAPTVEAYDEYSEILPSGHSRKTDIDVFLSYDYNLNTNI